jgi:hypothetical protein
MCPQKNDSWAKSGGAKGGSKFTLSVILNYQEVDI